MATAQTSHSKSPPLLAGPIYFQLAAGMILFGSAMPVSKIVTDAVPLFTGSLLRVAIGAVVLAPFLLRYRGEIANWRKRAAIALAVGGVLLMSWEHARMARQEPQNDGN